MTLGINFYKSDMQLFRIDFQNELYEEWRLRGETLSYFKEPLILPITTILDEIKNHFMKEIEEKEFKIKVTEFLLTATHYE